MAGKPKFLFGGEGGTYEDFEKKLLYEILKAGLTTEFKKKSFLYKHLTGPVLDTLTKLLFPIKISDKSFEELLVSLKTHYIPNKHLRERVLLYTRIQEEEEQTKDYFEMLRDIASRCQYNDAELKLVLCDKVLTGIRCPRLRESLFAAGISPSCTADQYMKYALLYEINVNNEKLANERNVNGKNKKLNINKNIDRSPSPDDKKSIPESPAAKFGVSLKKGTENNNINRNGHKGPVVWKPKTPLTPQSTFGVTLKSKSTSQVSPKSPSAPNIPLSNGTQDSVNGLQSPNPMTIPEIMEFVKDPRKPAFTQDKNKIIGNNGNVPKSAQQREPSWSPSPSPEPRKPVASTPESKHLLDKNNQNRKITKSPLRRESSWSPTPSPSPEPRDIRSQDTRGRSFVKDPTPKMKRSNSTLSIRDKPSINGLSTKETKTQAPKLKRSASSVSLSRNPLPELQEPFDPMRSLRQGLAALKSVKHLKPDPETINKKERFDISDMLPKLRSVGGCRRSPTEIVDIMPDILEITDIEPRKPTITPEAKRILEKYLNKPPPKMESPKIKPRREASYSPSPEPEPKPDLTKKTLINKCAKPSTSLPNKSMSYSDLTKSDLFENFLQAKNTQTSAQKSQKPFKINRPAKKDEVPQLTDEVRRKLEEKYGIIKGKPKEPTIEESLEPEIDKIPSRTQQSRDMFEEKTIASVFGVVKPSDRVVQMYKESQQVKDSLKEAVFPEKSNVRPSLTPTEKPLSTIKASPKIAEMYKAQIIERDKNKCPSPPPENVSSTITRFADKKWVSTLDLSSSRKEYNADYKTIKPLIWSPSVSPEPHDMIGPIKKETLKSTISREPSRSPSLSPKPQDEIPEIPEKIEARKSCITSETKQILDKYCNNGKETPKLNIKRETSRSPSVSPEPQDEIPEIPEKIEPRKSCITSETKKILDKYCNKDKETPKPSMNREPSWSPSVSPEPNENRDQLKEEFPKPSTIRDSSCSPSVSPEPKNNIDQLKKESPKPYIRRDSSRSPSLSTEPKDNRGELNKETPNPSVRRELSWSPSVSPEPKDNIGQLKKESPKPSIRRDSSRSPSVSTETKDNRGELNKETQNPSVREPSWSPSVSPEPKDYIGELKKENPNHSLRRESSWSPSPSPEPQDNRSESNKETSKVLETRQSSWSHSPSPEPQDMKRQFKEVSPKSMVRRDPSWSSSPSPEPRDTKCQDNRGRSSTREPSLQLKRSCSNINAGDKPSTNTAATASTLKRSCSSISISRNSRILNEIPEIPETIDMASETKRIIDTYCNKAQSKKDSQKTEKPETIDMDSETKRIIDTYCNKEQRKKDLQKTEKTDTIDMSSETKRIIDSYCNKAQSKTKLPNLLSEREPSYSPSPEPESRSDLTREQLFDKYANSSTTYQSKSSSYLDLTKSDVFDHFFQARDSPTPSSKVKKQIAVNKKSKKDEVKELTDEDRRKLEEKYGIIRGKPKEPKPEGEESPQPKRKRSPSRAQQSRMLFQEKEKALQNGIVKDTEKDEQKNDPLPPNQEKSNGITPKTPNEKPNIIIKTASNIAEKYKAELEKQNQKTCQSPLTDKAASIIARSSEKRSSIDLTPLDLSRMKKENDAQSLKKEALKFDVKECKYNAEVDYGDSLLKVSEKDAFNVRTIKTDFFPQDRANSPATSVIPPKPGSAAAAKPQFDISSFFDGSSYSNFLESAKSTKGGTK